jgi:hypothetical protein
MTVSSETIPTRPASHGTFPRCRWTIAEEDLDSTGKALDTRLIALFEAEKGASLHQVHEALLATFPHQSVIEQTA